MKKFLCFLMVGLLLCSTDVLGQEVFSKSEIIWINRRLAAMKEVDKFVSKPSFPTSDLFTVQDSTGKMVKRPFDELPADTRAGMYYFGRGVERNLDKAIECYEATIAEDSIGTIDAKHNLQYIKCLKESQHSYLDFDTKMCSAFVRNLGETNDYFEHVIQYDAPIAIKRERALSWVTSFFKPEEYNIESSDNPSKLIIKFRYKDIRLLAGYSISGQLILDFKDTRYRVRISYPYYSKPSVISSISPDEDHVIKLMNESRIIIENCFRAENGIDADEFGWELKQSKKERENHYKSDFGEFIRLSVIFLGIMEKYDSIFLTLEESIQKAVDDRKVKADDF